MVNIAAKNPYTGYGQDPYFLVGGGIAIARNEFYIHYMRGPKWGYEIADMQNGIAFQYLYRFKKPYSRIRLGCFFEYGRGRFYYNWGDGSSTIVRLFVKKAIFTGPAFEFTLLRSRIVDLNLKYNTGIFFWPWPFSYQAIGLDVSFKFKN